MIQIRTVEEPFDDPSTLRSAMSFLSRAETMGFLGEEDIDRLNVSTVREIIEAMTDAGLGVGPGAVLHLAENEISGADVAEVLAQLDGILESSPTPDTEWPVMENLFGIDTLAELLEVSPVSVRIRRWFGRSRQALDGAAPRELLTAEWDPDDAGPRRVRALARSLLASPVT
jgi:hypothetical protein